MIAAGEAADKGPGRAYYYATLMRFRRVVRGRSGNEGRRRSGQAKENRLIREACVFRRSRVFCSPNQHGLGFFAVFTEQPRVVVPSGVPRMPATCLVATALLPCACLVSPRLIRSTSETQGRHKADTRHPLGRSPGAAPQCCPVGQRHKSFALNALRSNGAAGLCDHNCV